MGVHQPVFTGIREHRSTMCDPGPVHKMDCATHCLCIAAMTIAASPAATAWGIPLHANVRNVSGFWPLDGGHNMYKGYGNLSPRH